MSKKSKTVNDLETERRHKTALSELYQKHGVGRNTKHKLAFWEAQHPNGYFISHNPTPKQIVAIMELTWLCDNYPTDFTFC